MGYYSDPEMQLELAKSKRREFQQEMAAIKLARETRNFQPGRIRTAVNRVIKLFKLALMGLKKRFGFGRVLREKLIAIRD